MGFERITVDPKRMGGVPCTSAGEGRMRDEETGTIWSMSTGEAIDGDLRGERLGVHLGMLSYTNAWESFFPESVRLPEE